MAGARRGDDPGSPMATFATGALAFMLAGAVTLLSTAYVDETELLAASGATASAVLWLVCAALTYWFQHDDGRIDAWERYWLDLLSFFVLLGYYYTTQTALVLFYGLTRAWPLPLWSELLLAVVLLLVLVIALLPRFTSYAAAPDKRRRS